MFTQGTHAARFAHNLVLPLAILTLIVQPTDGQTPTSTTELQRLEQELALRWESRRPPLYYELLESDDPVQRELNEDPDVYLVGIDSRGLPMYYTTHNIVASATTRTSEVWPFGGGGYSLTGANTRPGELAIWDGGKARWTHLELDGRIYDGDSWNFDNPHATHVAGTMIGSGVNPYAKGMSYEGTLLSFRWDDDFVEVTQQAAAGLQISNHSYGLKTGWSGYQWWGDVTLGAQEDWRFGFYDSLAMEWDQIAYNAPNLLMVRSAGNDRNDVEPNPDTQTHQHFENDMWVTVSDYHPPDGDPFGFDTIADQAIAKNVLTVGAVKDIPGAYTGPSDVVQTDFSSWGPADDGRIKPDLVANGDSVYSAYTYPDDDTSYAIKSGTSMAAPNASGSINLLRELYESIFPGKPRSATLKAVVIHTADEAGGADGPDYANGWGLLNTHAAADLISALPESGSGLTEAVLVNGNTDYYYFGKLNSGDIRVTLVWTDPAGIPPPLVIDPVAKMLVNDLDIRLEELGSGNTYEPWELDRTNPLGVAVRRDNDTDNVERIDHYNAHAGSYRVAVSHKGTITYGEQPYSLVWTGLVPTSSVGVDPGDRRPGLALRTPYPNPSTGLSVISFSLEKSGLVTIEIFDARGRVVKTLLRGVRPEGPGSIRLDTRKLSIGTYFVRMTVDSQQFERRLTVVR